MAVCLHGSPAGGARVLRSKHSCSSAESTWRGRGRGAGREHPGKPSSVRSESPDLQTPESELQLLLGNKPEPPFSSRSQLEDNRTSCSRNRRSLRTAEKDKHLLRMRLLRLELLKYLIQSLTPETQPSAPGAGPKSWF